MDFETNSRSSTEVDVAVEKQYMDYESNEPELVADCFTDHLQDLEEGKNTCNFQCNRMYRIYYDLICCICIGLKINHFKHQRVKC